MGALDGKVALVTGAGRPRGIGAAIALRLAREGARVVVSDLCRPPAPDQAHPGAADADSLAQVAEAVRAEGVDCLAVQADVTDFASVQALVAQTMEAFGRLDVLVNNAGVALSPAPVVQMDIAAWRKTLDVNVTGAFLCCKAALPAMMQSGAGGRVINMASLAARRPRPFMAAYAASKAALVALTQSLALEVAAFGITVNAVLPGDIDTDLKQWGLRLEAQVTGQPYEAVLQRAVAQIPVGRMGLPEDVAALVAFLASDEAAFVTGQAWNLTGGRELVNLPLPPMLQGE